MAPRSIELDGLRILDFYLLFPHLLRDARLPQMVKGRARRLGLEGNSYSLPAEPRTVFTQMAPIQTQGVKRLLSVGLAVLDLQDASLIRRSEMSAPGEISEAVARRNSEQKELVALLVGEVARMPVRGKDGLKDRTGLMEYRYDAV